MLTAFARAFKTPDLRKKLLFTLGIIVVYRVGTHIPIPGVDYTSVQRCVDEASGNQGIFGLVNMFSGGALLQITVFALTHPEDREADREKFGRMLRGETPEYTNENSAWRTTDSSTSRTVCWKNRSPWSCTITSATTNTSAL